MKSCTIARLLSRLAPPGFILSTLGGGNWLHELMAISCIMRCGIPSNSRSQPGLCTTRNRIKKQGEIANRERLAVFRERRAEPAGRLSEVWHISCQYLSRADTMSGKPRYSFRGARFQRATWPIGTLETCPTGISPMNSRFVYV